MRILCAFDFTCPDSWRVSRLLRNARLADEEIEVDWRPLSLKELNRPPEAPSVFESEPPSFSILALALALAAREADYEAFHHRLFDLLHADESVAEEDRRLPEPELLGLAGEAGVDTEGFLRERSRWVAAVRNSHEELRTRFGAKATPTLIFDEQIALMLVLRRDAAIPGPPRAAALLHRLEGTLFDYPELWSVRRSRPHQ